MVMRNCHEDTIPKTTFTSTASGWDSCWEIFFYEMMGLKTMQTGYEKQIAMCLLRGCMNNFCDDCIIKNRLIWYKFSYITFLIVINLQKSIPTWTTGPTQPGRTPSGLGEREWERGLKMYLWRSKKKNVARALPLVYRSQVVKRCQTQISKEKCEVNS